MTKYPDWEGALKAALVVAKQVGPPFRYQVVDNANQLIALTLTKWAAEEIVKAFSLNRNVGLHPYWVRDMDGLDLEPGEEA